MKLTILGGGGFRTPLVYRALLADLSPRLVKELWRQTRRDLTAARG